METANSEITTFLHCVQCGDERPDGQSLREWARFEFRLTADGRLQVWCLRHEREVGTFRVAPFRSSRDAGTSRTASWCCRIARPRTRSSPPRPGSSAPTRVVRCRFSSSSPATGTIARRAGRRADHEEERTHLRREAAAGDRRALQVPDIDADHVRDLRRGPLAPQPRRRRRALHNM